MSDTPGTETPQVNLEHPWVEASLIGAPRPVEIQGKCEAYELNIADGKTIDVGLLTFITPVGVLNFYFTPATLGEFTMQCAETMDQITAAQRDTPKLVLADTNTMRQETERARAAERLRG